MVSLPKGCLLSFSYFSCFNERYLPALNGASLRYGSEESEMAGRQLRQEASPTQPISGLRSRNELIMAAQDIVVRSYISLVL